MSVALSFQKYPTVGEAYEKNNRLYIKIQYPDGHLREVRWYAETPSSSADSLGKKIRTRRDVLGFGDYGYIYIMRGDTEPLQEWFEESPALYNKWFFWYFTENTIPDFLPAGIEAVKLYWEEVADVANDELKPDSVVAEAVSAKLYPTTKSQYFGTVGSRHELTLTLDKTVIIPNDKWGDKTMFLFSDNDENVFSWTTTAKHNLTIGQKYSMKATIKNHHIYHNEKQTDLSNARNITAI